MPIDQNLILYLLIRGFRYLATTVHQLRWEGQAAQERADALIALCTEQGFPFLLAWGTNWRGWALAAQGQGEEGITHMCQGLAAFRATGAGNFQSLFLALLAEAYGKVGRAKEGLDALAEALSLVDKNGERCYEAELYRLKGELTLQKLSVDSSRLSVPTPQHLTRSIHAEAEQEAEDYFLKAIEIARRQSAKSLELRAVMSVSRLWKQQGKKKEAHQLLSEIYGWFTEGFDTHDLQEAKAVLEELN